MTKKCKSNRQKKRGETFQHLLLNSPKTSEDNPGGLDFVPHLFHNLKQSIRQSYDPKATELALANCKKMKRYLKDNKIRICNFTLYYEEEEDEEEGEYWIGFFCLPATGHPRDSKSVMGFRLSSGASMYNPENIYGQFAEIFNELMNEFPYSALQVIATVPQAGN